jgi:hypothetical protein
MNNGASLSMGSAGQSAVTSSISSCHQKSRPSCIVTSQPTRFSTMHFSTVGDFFNASSTLAFNGICLPRRQPASAVICTFVEASLFRSAIASAEKPANTIEWTAPMRAQANMAMANSGTIGMYMATMSPLPTPSCFNTLANLHTSWCKVW